MLTQEELDIVHAGAAAERLIAYPEWARFAESIKELREQWVRQALVVGDTNFAKGCVQAIDTILNSPKDTMARRSELIERERLLRQKYETGDEENEDLDNMESVP